MTSGTEIETKFLVRDLDRLAARLAALGARVVQPRTHETNLRFDLPDGSLRRARKVLRLRRDDKARLTFKGPGELIDGIRARQEIEFVVEDFEMARALVEALGYQVSMMYEKFRTTYALEGMLVMLDEMPYGLFVEIEGDNAPGIYALAEKLELKRECNICDSYQVLFDRVRHQMGLSFTDLSFDNFAGVHVSPSVLGADYAD